MRDLAVGERPQLTRDRRQRARAVEARGRLVARARDAAAPELRVAGQQGRRADRQLRRGAQRRQLAAGLDAGIAARLAVVDARAAVDQVEAGACVDAVLARPAADAIATAEPDDACRCRRGRRSRRACRCRAGGRCRASRRSSRPCRSSAACSSRPRSGPRSPSTAPSTTEAAGGERRRACPAPHSRNPEADAPNRAGATKIATDHATRWASATPVMERRRRAVRPEHERADEGEDRVRHRPAEAGDGVGGTRHHVGAGALARMRDRSPVMRARVSASSSTPRNTSSSASAAKATSATAAAILAAAMRQLGVRVDDQAEPEQADGYGTDHEDRIGRRREAQPRAQRRLPRERRDAPRADEQHHADGGRPRAAGQLMCGQRERGQALERDEPQHEQGRRERRQACVPRRPARGEHAADDEALEHEAARDRADDVGAVVDEHLRARRRRRSAPHERPGRRAPPR